MNFIDFLALPFFRNFGRFDQKFCHDVVAILLENRRQWKIKLKEE